MKKLLFCIVLVALTALPRHTVAQGSYNARYSRTERMFNLHPPFINHIHTAHLQNEEKLVLEFSDLVDYVMIESIDTALSMLMKDLEFYKDSLSAAANVRIEYIFNGPDEERMLRFKKYSADGDLFVMQGNEVSRLKVGQDTIHIRFNKKMSDRGYFYDFPAQATFYLNSYTNLDTLRKNKGLLHAVIDTMAKIIPRPNTNPESDFPRVIKGSQSVVDYYPYAKENKIIKSNVILPIGSLSAPLPEKMHSISVNARMGAGLVRNAIAPMGDIGLQYNDLWGASTGNVSFIRLSVTPYFLFERNATGSFITYDNWFVNAKIGSRYDDGVASWWLGKEACFGLGYLVSQKGGYYKNNTFKLFTELEATDKIRIVPEIIVTDNFKQIFPGITVKIF